MRKYHSLEYDQLVHQPHSSQDSGDLSHEA